MWDRRYAQNPLFSAEHIAAVWKWTESPDQPAAAAISGSDGLEREHKCERPEVISKKQNIIAVHVWGRFAKDRNPSIAPKNAEKNITNPQTYSILTDDSVTERVRQTAKVLGGPGIFGFSGECT